MHSNIGKHLYKQFKRSFKRRLKAFFYQILRFLNYYKRFFVYFQHDLKEHAILSKYYKKSNYKSELRLRNVIKTLGPTKPFWDLLKTLY